MQFKTQVAPKFISPIILINRNKIKSKNPKEIAADEANRILGQKCSKFSSLKKKKTLTEP
jgi:hypothetical protein